MPLCLPGDSFVEFECEEPTDVILIHSNKLNYTKFGDHDAKLESVGGSTVPVISQTFAQTTTQYLVIQLQSQLEKGQRYRLHTKFTGELADDLGGFYRSEYDDGEGKKYV